MGPRIEVKPGRVRLDPGPIEPWTSRFPETCPRLRSFSRSRRRAAVSSSWTTWVINPGRTVSSISSRGWAPRSWWRPTIVPRTVEPRGRITVRTEGLRGIDVTAVDVPRAIDELPLLAVVATARRQ